MERAACGGGCFLDMGSPLQGSGEALRLMILRLWPGAAEFRSPTVSRAHQPQSHLAFTATVLRGATEIWFGVRVVRFDHFFLIMVFLICKKWVVRRADGPPFTFLWFALDGLSRSSGPLVCRFVCCVRYTLHLQDVAYCGLPASERPYV
jgi:hypothetical protein